MQVTIQEQDGNMIVTLEGRLDTAAAPETEKAMSPLLDCEGKDIILDCTKMEYISSSGLRIFLSIMKNTNGRHVYIRNITDDVRAVFVMTGFIHLFEFK